ncbi:hypothetical protein Taro_049180 [Colocasia esculenta]|uniref:Uncharacterized protein n=1 Tax=Colocasia esculenta TaxID=4460 RepID=A0A843XAC6_COLES|nr:hypothetical protein [Colocasia esculenta]
MDMDTNIPDLLRFQIQKRLRKLSLLFGKPFPTALRLAPLTDPTPNPLQYPNFDQIHPFGSWVMASRGRRGVPARDGEQRRDEPRLEDQGEQQAPAPQGPVLPPPPPVDYGVFMQGLVQAMQTQAHTQAALQAQSEPMYGGPRCYVLGSRMVPWKSDGMSS